MIYDKGTLERLSNLELRQYAGNLNAISGEDATIYDMLVESPIKIKVTAQRGICEDELYDICLSLEGRHDRFIDVRHAIIESYIKKISPMQKMRDTGVAQSPCLLSMLFDGIYVGDSEDLLNYRNNNQAGILYNTKGLGAKLAEVTFIG